MSSIDGVGAGPMTTNQPPDGPGADPGADGGGFGAVMSKVADGALAGVSALAPIIPGGQLVGMAADGLRELKGSAPGGGMPGAQDEQMHEMFQMQRESQAFNLQYLELQTALQDDNRRFSTLTNLMKVRHDTAKSAINNMHA